MNTDDLENLASLLSSQVKNSDWLETNTPEKWIAENPELHAEMQEQIKKAEEAQKEKK